ncbi:MAG: Adenylate kinase [Firmicutes bacterium ADurb.Bin080]|jgi:adenylate kinase|nr:MAG: Adenylate kinase [Firmicutes bacterium ADurb.Bin080]
MNIVLLGAPGAGKGSQAVVMSAHYGIPHISTGDVLRANIKNQTEIGKYAKQFIEKGLLVPDEVVDKIVANRISEEDCKKGFILDGYPRTINQADALGGITKLDYVIVIDVDYSVIVKRISGRRMCSCGATYNTSTYDRSDCAVCGKKLFTRDDDKEETVLKRLEVYEKNTAPLLDYYSKKGLILKVDGSETVEKTFENVLKALNNANN